MGCAGTIDAFEESYLGALEDVEAAARPGEALVLTGDDVSLRFEPMPRWPERAVVDRSWRLHRLTTDADGARRASASDRDGGPGDRALLRLGGRGPVGQHVLERFTVEVGVRAGHHELVLTAALVDPDGSRRQLVYRR